MSLEDQSHQWFPTSVQVTVRQARGLRIKGKHGTNDAYAVMQVAKDKFSTSVAEKCVAPVWGEEATFALPLLRDSTDRSTLHVYVMHRALVGPDKMLGQAVINLLEVYENKSRDKTEWFKLLGKTGKTDKARGDVLLDIQFMKNNMTASMFDLSGQDKPRSRIGKLKDKFRGKKEEGLSDSASAIVPHTQGMIDSEGEEPEGAATPAKEKKKALKSLFGAKSNLQRNTSQSMSMLSSLPERDSALTSSVGSGLNLDPTEGKKKFKFLMHKRTGSSDLKPSQSAAGPHPPVTVCINGSHVYSEETEPRSATGTSGRESTEDLHRTQDRSGSGAGVDTSPLTHGRHAEEQRDREEKERVKMEREKEERKEEEQRRKVEEEQEKEEQRRRIEEEKENTRKEKEEQRRKIEEEKERRRVEQEKRRMAEEKKMREEEERKRAEEERESAEARRKEEEKMRAERKRKEEEERMKMEQQEENKRLAEERLRKEEQRKIEMERRLVEEKEKQRREEERMKVERKRREEEEKRIHEEQRKEKERQTREEQNSAELPKRGRREPEWGGDGSESEQESSRTRAGDGAAGASPEATRREKPSVAVTSSSPFEDPPTTSQSAGHTRLARVTVVKPSTSISGLVSQMPVGTNTNPFLDGYSSGTLSTAEGGTGRNPKKGPAPLPRQNKTQVLTPTVPPRVFKKTQQETNAPSSSRDMAKYPAPSPPDRWKETRGAAAEDLAVQSSIVPNLGEENTLESPETHQPTEVMSVSEDDLKPCSTKTQQGQNFIKIDRDSSQAGGNQSTSVHVSTVHTVLMSDQSETSESRGNAEPSRRVGPGTATHNKGPAPARPSAVYTPNRKSGSEDEPSHHSVSPTEDTHHREVLPSAASNSHSNEEPSNEEPPGGESYLVANDTKANSIPHAGEISSNIPAFGSVERNLGDNLPGIKDKQEHLENVDSVELNALSCVDQHSCPESGAYDPDRLPDMKTSTGASTKKTRAPVPPTKPKRVVDPSSLDQQSSFPKMLSSAEHSHAWGGHSSKTGGNIAADLTTRAQLSSSSLPPRTSSGFPPPAGSGPKPPPRVRVVSTDGQPEHGLCSAGGGGAGATAARTVRAHAVKPLSAADRQTDHREAQELQATGGTILLQPKTKAVEASCQGPYSQLTHAELTSMVVQQQKQLCQRDARIQELEQYIDNLLVRVMEENPSILMNMPSQKKAV
ncbi:hypothetical protein P4O66_005492 [Electrophorus voltai]|uniref:C2 domain-containing protein n=1 Tax=Electrophorus voltai TaxID=2609070 RepID=A0AAD8ZLM1_9TELE|nr:hypothetical protein P4O66_005492 [Electrophorus voltai]